MRVICNLFFSIIVSTANGQVNHHGPPCGGMSIYDVGVNIKGYQVLDYHGIRYSEINADSLRKGFEVSLIDTSHKLIWFLIVYSNRDEVKEYSISGHRVTSFNAEFLRKINPGDHLSLECINITRDGFTALSTNFKIVVSR